MITTRFTFFEDSYLGTKYFSDREKRYKTTHKKEELVDMADAVITEFAGTRKGPITRFYQYGREGIRVLDAGKNVKHLYLFGPSGMMTEHDPRNKEKILRRFIFDPNGMLEETFSFGRSPRTFRYEDGGLRIAVREGGQYGAVGKTFSFDHNGILETAWGREGEIERVFIFDAGNDAIMERTGGWYGPVSRTIVFEGIEASVFREPEAFLQLVVFSERGEDEEYTVRPDVAPASAQGVGGSPARSRYAFNGKRKAPSGTIQETGGKGEDIQIDFIPDGDAPVNESRSEKPRQKKSSEISYDERRSGR